MILDCYKVLKMIERRPSSFIGKNTLEGIRIFAYGYYHAILNQNIVTHTTDPFFDWVASKLGYFESTAGWVNMIVAESIGFNTTDINWNEFLKIKITNEQHSISINRFYELLEEFKKEMENKNN